MEYIALAGLGYSIYSGTQQKKPPSPTPTGAPATEIPLDEEVTGKKKRKYRPMMFMGDESLSLGIAGKTVYGGERLS